MLRPKKYLTRSNKIKKLRVALVAPNFRWCDWDIGTLWHFIPYNLCLLAAMVEDICHVSILDAHESNMNEDEFIYALKKVNPDIVGITVLMDQYGPTGHNAARLVKSLRKDIITIIGGVYATLNTQKVIEDSNIDFVVIGEGEYIFRDLIGYFMGNNPLPQKGICYRLNERVIDTGHSDFIQDLDSIPLPAYHLINFEKYAKAADRKSVDSPRRVPYARILSSRGCPFSCVFCQVKSITGNKFRPRSAKNVLDEIQYLKDNYGIKSIIFDDDNFFIERQRAKDILQGMIDRNLVMPWLAGAVAVFKLDEELIKLMRVSGCEYIDVAIESGTERVLKKIIKKPVNLEHAKKMVRLARKEGIYVAANFIVGFPTETWDEIRQTMKLAEDIDVDYVKLYGVIPLRNTELWELCEKEGAFKKDFEESNVKWGIGQTETHDFSANDLTVLQAYEWDRINFTSPEKRKRTAVMMSVTEEELYDIRRKTLNNACQSIM